MFEKFRKKIPLSEEKWNEYISYFQRIEVPARTIILKEGEVSSKGFVIETGSMRAWLNQDGNDKTCQFFFENHTVLSLESFKKGIPSVVNIETTECCILWWISKDHLEKIIAEINENATLRTLFTDAIFERTFHYMKQYVSFIKDSPTQRYLNIIRENPQIILRIPQHYVASYLGITKVHLSRIKNKLTKQTIQGFDNKCYRLCLISFLP